MHTNKTLKNAALISLLGLLLLCCDWNTGLQARDTKSWEGVRGLAWSPDGTQLAVANPAGRVAVMDREGRLLRVFGTHASGEATSVSWSPDGKLLASGGSDDQVYIWEVSTGELYRSFGDVYSGIDLRWSPNGDYLIGVDFDRFRIWNTTTWELDFGTSATIPDIQWSHTGDLIAFSNMTALGLMNAKTFEMIEYFKRETPTYALAWSPDDRYVLSGGQGGVISRFDVESMQFDVFAEIDGIIMDIKFSPDGASVIVATTTGEIYLLDVAEKQIQLVSDTSAFLIECAWHPDGETVTCGGIKDFHASEESVYSREEADQTAFMEVLSISEMGK